MSEKIGKLKAFEETAEVLVNCLRTENKPLTPEELSDRVGMFLAWVSGKLSEAREELEDEMNQDKE